MESQMVFPKELNGMVIIYFDGLNEPVNPGGIACWGYVIEYNNRVILDHGVLGAGMLGQYTTNNMAEYTGLIKALERLLTMGFRGKVRVYGDSQLVINQMRGFWAVRSQKILPFFERSVDLARKFERVEFLWVPREENSSADEQTNLAYKEFVEKNTDRFVSYYSKYLGTEKQQSLLGSILSGRTVQS
ncbi:MAG: ribonuclease HI [Thermoplasmata archaeon]